MIIKDSERGENKTDVKSRERKEHDRPIMEKI